MINSTVLFLEPKGTILEIIRAAHKRGFNVIALTTERKLIYEAPEPYSSAVDCISQTIDISSWEDHNRVLDICSNLHRENKIVGVYAGMDTCAVIGAKVRRMLGLPTSDPKCLETTLNKFLMRTKLRESGLSQLKSIHGDEADQWTDWKFCASAYFKPLHGFFSAYVERCEHFEDFVSARTRWTEGNNSDPGYVRRYVQSGGSYHLEQAIDGELLSVEGFSQNGEFQSLGLLSRILYSKNPVVEMGSCFPYPHELESKIVELVSKAHQVLGLTEGPSHTEVIVAKDGRIEIIDLNPRFVGAEVLQSINCAYGISVQETLLDYALGKPIPRVPTQQNRYSCLQYFLSPPLDSLKEVRLPDSREVNFSTSFIKPGTRNLGGNRQLDYLGCYLTVMPTFQQALDQSLKLREQILVNGTYEGVF